MKPSYTYYTLILLTIFIFNTNGMVKLKKPAAEMTLKQKIARFVPTEISADISKLTAGDKKALEKIIDAARLMDPVYLEQVWYNNFDLLKRLESDTSSDGNDRLHYFRINMGPWSLLDNNEYFIFGNSVEKPSGANYYPQDMTKEEFTKWSGSLPELERAKATGFFHVIRRDMKGNLKNVPYSEEYKKYLKPASDFLKEAAEFTDNKTLKKYLLSRADAFISNDYYDSDVAWMELDAPIELTIGPYETYMDELFGYKAAFEAFVTLRDEEESAKLKKFSSYLQEIENNLPIDPKYRNPGLAELAPIRVVDVIYVAGDGNRGVQTAAFNLPNDERIVQEKGSKRVMLRNIQEAKFNRILGPISKIVLDSSQLSQISFNAFFTHILAHELMHGLGPHNIIINGKQTNVRQELKDIYPAIEEAKADITGLFALQYLIDKGYIDKHMENEMYATYLASMFRSVRFGINEAHGKGVAMQFNFLMEEGAIKYDTKTENFSIDQVKIKEAVKKLTEKILTIEAEGSYINAKNMIDTYAHIQHTMQIGLDKLGIIPIDIEPLFSLVPLKHGSIR